MFVVIRVRLEIDREKLRMWVMNRLTSIADEVLAEAKKNLFEDDHVVTRRLIDSSFIEARNRRYEVLFGFDCPYAGFVEFGTGRRAKLPPVERLHEWAKLKFGLNDRDAWRVAWVIAEKIKEKGTEPTFFFSKAMRKVMSGVGEGVRWMGRRGRRR